MTPEMQAGRELDALVAEKIMGYDVKWLPTALSDSQPHYANSDEGSGWLYCRHYSTDIAAAWLVVERMQCIDDRGWWPQVTWLQDFDGVNKWQASMHAPPRVWSAMADTAPLAICLAALAALGGAP